MVVTLNVDFSLGLGIYEKILPFLLNSPLPLPISLPPFYAPKLCVTGGTNLHMAARVYFTTNFLLP